MGEKMSSGSGAAPLSLRSSASPAVRYSVAAVYQRVEPVRVQNFLRHVVLEARSQDEALGAAIALIEKKDYPAGALPEGAGLAMHSVMLMDRSASEDRTEQSEALQSNEAHNE